MVHVAVDPSGRPLALVVGPATEQDRTRVAEPAAELRFLAFACLMHCHLIHPCSSP